MVWTSDFFFSWRHISLRRRRVKLAKLWLIVIGQIWESSWYEKTFVWQGGLCDVLDSLYQQTISQTTLSRWSWSSIWFASKFLIPQDLRRWSCHFQTWSACSLFSRDGWRIPFQKQAKIETEELYFCEVPQESNLILSVGDRFRSLRGNNQIAIRLFHISSPLPWGGLPTR